MLGRADDSCENMEVGKVKHLLVFLAVLSCLVLAGCSASPTPDLEATVKSAVEATRAAEPTATPTIEPTPTSTTSDYLREMEAYAVQYGGYLEEIVRLWGNPEPGGTQWLSDLDYVCEDVQELRAKLRDLKPPSDLPSNIYEYHAHMLSAIQDTAASAKYMQSATASSDLDPSDMCDANDLMVAATEHWEDAAIAKRGETVPVRAATATPEYLGTIEIYEAEYLEYVLHFSDLMTRAKPDNGFWRNEVRDACDNIAGMYAKVEDLELSVCLSEYHDAMLTAMLTAAEGAAYIEESLSTVKVDARLLEKGGDLLRESGFLFSDAVELR